MNPFETGVTAFNVGSSKLQPLTSPGMIFLLSSGSGTYEISTVPSWETCSRRPYLVTRGSLVDIALMVTLSYSRLVGLELWKPWYPGSLDIFGRR